jgi:hypothetical protein
MSAPPQTVDPAVSRAKFEREVTELRAHERHYRNRGWLLMRAEFPEAFVVMAAPQLKPPAIITGVLFDYTDYDLRPPSVRLADPFTEVPYKPQELPTALLRQTEVEGVSIGFQLPPGLAGPPKLVQQQPLMQSYPGIDELPFMCLAGVRQYHDHPAHSGDRWELHRTAGAGRLVRLLEVIDTYGVRPVNAYEVSLNPQVSGLRQAEVPL